MQRLKYMSLMVRQHKMPIVKFNRKIRFNDTF